MTRWREHHVSDAVEGCDDPLGVGMIDLVLGGLGHAKPRYCAEALLASCSQQLRWRPAPVETPESKRRICLCPLCTR